MTESTITLAGNSAAYGTAQVTTSASMVKVLAMDNSTRLSLCLELAPACALQLAQALHNHAAALLAQSEGGAA